MPISERELLAHFGRRDGKPTRKRRSTWELPSAETLAKRAEEAKRAADGLDAWRERMYGKR